MVNPMGHDPETVWSGLKEGQSGVAKTTLFDASGFPTKISAEVKNWDITDSGESAEEWKDRGRHTKFAAGAAKQAIADSGVLDSISDHMRVGINSIEKLEFMRTALRVQFTNYEISWENSWGYLSSEPSLTNSRNSTRSPMRP